MIVDSVVRGALVAAIIGSAVAPDVRAASKDAVAAAIAGGVVGLAVGAAISKKYQQDRVIYVPGYQPPYPPGGYPAAWGQSFSPRPGVICYPMQRACYDVGGAYNPTGTARTLMLQ
jgi:hypothetical protein